MNSRNNLNIKISLFIIIPIIVIIMICCIITIMYTYNISRDMSLSAIDQISEVKLLNMKDVVNSELNFIRSIKIVSEELYSSSIRNRKIYEKFMDKFAKNISENAEAVFLLFLPNAIDDDNIYRNDSLYKNINGQFGIYIGKDKDGNISRLDAENLELKSSFIENAIEKNEMYITPIYTVQMQNKYKQIQTYIMPIYSNDDKIIGIIGLDMSSASMNFYKENDISITLFDENGNIIYCNTDVEIIGENFTNLYHPYNNYNVMDIVNSNESLIIEKYNFKNLNRYFYIVKPIELFDNVHWGIEVAVPSAMVLKNNSKMFIMIGIMISVMIILIIIIIPNIINRKVIPVINFINKNKYKMKSYNIDLNNSVNNIKSDKITDMNADNNNTIEYLNSIINVLKDNQYKISNNSKLEVSNDDKSNNNYKFVNCISDNYKSIADESEELKNIIEYFKLIK
ncbi:putative Methyl-accepting chemotaxis protein [Brachyspira hampsonii 30446]|uniref:Putative Methyl-accepting chemotaxis protein n=1 Tax=Brachyspira hampsonii 30446 TaxID=1289135 RepID=A0A2U4F779_9SPIR|nr:cache domain-containing protein [Brachyspira hampsonii]EKV57060.1 putative Methyl-accepting chemotaxis protein [Brachyspira hampsonii 30446]MBW5393502.1 chemotaxis protein [Brachyspira hampsonii]OEJ19275.1 chemotaxis protein [Brachyspira hampsonii]